MPRWTSSSGYFFGRPIAAEALLSRGQKPRFEVSAKPGLAQCDPPIRSGRRSGSADVSFVSLAVSAPVVAAGWFALPWLLLYSDEFDVAVPPARILLIAAVARFPGTWFKTLAAALGKPEPRRRAGQRGNGDRVRGDFGRLARRRDRDRRRGAAPSRGRPRSGD
jgi:hypothetical protein